MSKKSWVERIVPFLVVVAVIQSFFIGLLWEKIKQTKAGSEKVAGKEVGGAQATPVVSQAPVAPTTGKLSSTQVKAIPQVTESDHIRGNKDAKLTWIEYSDFECPFCKNIHPNLKKMLSEYQGKVRWVYRQFPLESLHAKALPAAVASECVAKLAGNEVFWTFADEVFEGAPTSLNDLTTLATEAGANKDEFESCIKDPAIETLVRSQLTGGEKAGVTGTPGNFLLDGKGNGWIIPGAVPYEQIKAAIEEALQS